MSKKTQGTRYQRKMARRRLIKGLTAPAFGGRRHK